MPREKLDYCLKMIRANKCFLEVGKWEMKFLEYLEINFEEGEKLTESQSIRLDFIFDRIVNK